MISFNQWYEYGRPNTVAKPFSIEPEKCEGCCEKLDEIRRLKIQIKSLKTKLKNEKEKLKQ